MIMKKCLRQERTVLSGRVAKNAFLMMSVKSFFNQAKERYRRYCDCYKRKMDLPAEPTFSLELSDVREENIKMNTRTLALGQPTNQMVFCQP